MRESLLEAQAHQQEQDMNAGRRSTSHTSAESECTVAKKLKLAQASETVGSGSGSSSEGAVLPLQAGWLAKRCMAPTILSCAAASELAQQVHDALKDAVAAAPLHLTHSRARARKAAVRARSTLDAIEPLTLDWIVSRLLAVDDKTLEITKRVQRACELVSSDMIGVHGRVGIFEKGAETPSHMHQQLVVNLLVKGRKLWHIAPPGKYTLDEFYRMAVPIYQDAGSVIVIPPYCGARSHAAFHAVSSVHAY